MFSFSSILYVSKYKELYFIAKSTIFSSVGEVFEEEILVSFEITNINAKTRVRMIDKYMMGKIISFSIANTIVCISWECLNFSSLSHFLFLY